MLIWLKKCGELTGHNNVPFGNETSVENITINTKINRHYITEMVFNFLKSFVSVVLALRSNNKIILEAKSPKL